MPTLDQKVLDQLRRGGAEYLVVPATSGWWLDHYEALARYLEDDHRRIADAEGRFVAFAIGAAEPAAPPAKAVAV